MTDEDENHQWVRKMAIVEDANGGFPIIGKCRVQTEEIITIEIDHEKEKEIESIIKNVIPTISDKDFFITRIKNDSYCLLTFFTRISMEDISGILFETKLKLISIDCDGYLWPNDAGKWRPAFILKCKLHSF